MFNVVNTVRSPINALAMLLAVALLLWTSGALNTARAANLVELSNTLTDSAPSAQSGHLFEFTVPAGSDITGDVVIDFPAGDFTDVGTVVDGDVTVIGMAGSPSASGSGDTVTITGGTASANDTITVEIADSVITNPASTGSYEFTVTTNTTAGTDVGNTRVHINDTVTVTASVDTTFDFVISGVATTGEAVTGVDNTTGTTSATEIPFGTLTAGNPEVLAQDLSVTTNAGNGFVVTVEQDQNLLSATGADIDGFIDGAYTNAPATWASPSNNVNDENTWGHWGLTSNDTDLDSMTTGDRSFTTNDGYVAASTTPVEVFAHNDPSDGTTQDIGTARVGYKIEITALQEAAEDYTTTLTYIATPTF